MRHLATVQIIKSISPIEGADRIELVHVLGWQCVAKKGEFKEGDYCVYFEIDSFLPIEDERFAFLKDSSYKKNEILGEGYHLKTMMLRGQISQGLVMPASDFPELWIDPIEGMACVVPSEGQDVTELLHVREYEIPEQASSDGTIIGGLPAFMKKTDETRIQACPELLREFEGKPYYISTKMDGYSHSIGLDYEGAFFVTGHNYRYKDDGKSSFYNFVKKNEYEEKLRERFSEIEHIAHDHVSTIVIKGEYCGPGLQKNRLKLNCPHWYVFTVDINEKRCNLETSRKIAAIIEAEFVPVEEIGENLLEKYPDEDALLKRAEGTYPNGGPKEGIVIRPIQPVYSYILNADLSMKIINNKYLLKQSKE